MSAHSHEQTFQTVTIRSEFRPTQAFHMNHCSSQLDPEETLVTELTILSFWYQRDQTRYLARCVN